MKKRRWTTIVLLIAFFIGLSVALYPTLSDYWNSLTQSEAIVDYEKMLQSMTKEDYTKYFEDAEAYNEQLKNLHFPFVEYKQLEGYDELLDLTGTGMM